MKEHGDSEQPPSPEAMGLGCARACLAPLHACPPSTHHSATPRDLAQCRGPTAGARLRCPRPGPTCLPPEMGRARRAGLWRCPRLGRALPRAAAPRSPRPPHPGHRVRSPGPAPPPSTTWDAPEPAPRPQPRLPLHYHLPRRPDRGEGTPPPQTRQRHLGRGRMEHSPSSTEAAAAAAAPGPRPLPAVAPPRAPAAPR